MRMFDGWQEERSSLSHDRVWLAKSLRHYDVIEKKVVPRYHIRQWLDENTTAPWRCEFGRLIPILIFDEPKDAVIYKLFWSDAE